MSSPYPKLESAGDVSSSFVCDQEIANEMDFLRASAIGSVNESATDVYVSPSCVFYLYGLFYSFCALCHCAQNQVTSLLGGHVLCYCFFHLHKTVAGTHPLCLLYLETEFHHKQPLGPS